MTHNHEHEQIVSKHGSVITTGGAIPTPVQPTLPPAGRLSLGSALGSAWTSMFVTRLVRHPCPIPRKLYAYQYSRVWLIHCLWQYQCLCIGQHNPQPPPMSWRRSQTLSSRGAAYPAGSRSLCFSGRTWHWRGHCTCAPSVHHRQSRWCESAAGPDCPICGVQ